MSHLASFFKNNPLFSVDDEDNERLHEHAAVQAPVQNNGVSQVFSQINNNGVIWPNGQAPFGIAQQPTIPIQQPATGLDITKFIDYFNDLLTKTKTSTGPDYHEFMSTFKSMSALGLMEDKLYQATWASLKTQAPTLTIAQLIDSIQKFLQVLEADKQTSIQKIDANIQSDTANLNTEIQSLQSDSDQAQKTIQELQNKIAQNSNTILEKRQQIDTRTFKLNNNKNGYLTALDQTTKQINNDLVKVSQYLHD